MRNIGKATQRAPNARAEMTNSLDGAMPVPRRCPSLTACDRNEWARLLHRVITRQLVWRGDRRCLVEFEMRGPHNRFRDRLRHPLHINCRADRARPFGERVRRRLDVAVTGIVENKHLGLREVREPRHSRCWSDLALEVNSPADAPAAAHGQRRRESKSYKEDRPR